MTYQVNGGDFVTIVLTQTIRHQLTHIGGCLTYTVARGDSLWQIAQTTLGDPHRWVEIASLNKITNAGVLMIGQSLNLPAGVTLRSAPVMPAAIQPVGGGTGRQPASLIPAKVHFYVVADEVLPSRKVVRKVMVVEENSPKLRINAPKILGGVLHPEKSGFSPVDAASPLSIGRHAMGSNASKYISASDAPFGSPRIQGTPYWIDVVKAKAAGVSIHETEDIFRDLDRIQVKTKGARTLAAIERTRWTIQADREILLEGAVPASAVKGAAAVGLTRGFQVLSGVGIVLTAYDLEQAGSQSVHEHSIKPLANETIKQASGWGGALAGARIGASLGAAVGIETGPGAVLTAAGGALLFGTIGYFSGDWLSRHLW